MQNNSYNFCVNENVKISAFIIDSDHNGLKTFNTMLTNTTPLTKTSTAFNPNKNTELKQRKHMAFPVSSRKRKTAFVLALDVKRSTQTM